MKIHSEPETISAGHSSLIPCLKNQEPRSLSHLLIISVALLPFVTGAASKDEVSPSRRRLRHPNKDEDNWSNYLLTPNGTVADEVIYVDWHYKDESWRLKVKDPVRRRQSPLWSMISSGYMEIFGPD